MNKLFDTIDALPPMFDVIALACLTAVFGAVWLMLRRPWDKPVRRVDGKLACDDPTCICKRPR